VTTPRRRFFWGRSLVQALSRAARYHGVAPERLDYRLRDKRHGFVKHPRAVIVEIDPERPLRDGADAPPPALPASPEPPSRPRPASSMPPASPASSARGETDDDAVWEAPDGDSELAAVEAAHRLLSFAGLELDVTVARDADALRLTLDGADRQRLAAVGVELLDALEALLPRAVTALARRRVRCHVDGAGLRARREAELRALAAGAASRARARGDHILEPLPPAERRAVHMMLRDEPGLATESLGRGFLKRLRVYATETPRGEG
jgi:spoIIIJ-associated protein